MIAGQWHAEGSAASSKARLISEDQKHYILELEDGTRVEGRLSTLEVGNRLGNIERKITLEDGSVFVTKENDKVDSLFKGQLKTNSLIHALESHMGWVMVALVVTILTTFSFFKWGVPWASNQIAHALPEKTNQIIAANTLDFLDKFMFETSTLDTDKQEKIRRHFHGHIASLGIENKEIVYKLNFRSWRDGNLSIPNALALPSGDLVLTDKFVELCQSQEEMDAVLLHEMGHVVHRHTLEMVIESTFITVAVMLMVGDSNGLADMGVGLGSLLVSSAYSRGHESEADTYAFDHMLRAKIDPASFSRIMDRMTRYMQEQTNKSGKKNRADKNEVKESEDSFLDYLSSHPNTKKRIEIADQYSECYKKGLSICDIAD